MKKKLTDAELGELLGNYPPEPELKPNLDTSTPEGQAWRLHVLQKPLREWEANQSLKDYNPYFDERG